MIKAIKTTTANKIDGMDILIKRGMEDYSGWGMRQHLEWLCDLSGLPYTELFLLVNDGYVILTDEEVSEVWLICKDKYNSKARLIFQEYN